MRSEHAKTLKKSADKSSQKEKIVKRNRDKVPVLLEIFVTVLSRFLWKLLTESQTHMCVCATCVSFTDTRMLTVVTAKPLMMLTDADG